MLEPIIRAGPISPNDHIEAFANVLKHIIYKQQVIPLSLLKSSYPQRRSPQCSTDNQMFEYQL